MSAHPGQAKPGPLQYQQCPHCGTKKLYSRERILEILEQFAVDRIFPCENRHCRKQIFIGLPPAFALAKVHSAPTSKSHRRPSGRVPALEKPEMPIALKGDETRTTDEVPAPDDTTKAGSNPNERRLRLDAVKKRVRQAADAGLLIRDRYKCESVVGEGATGIVIAARDGKTGALVALKVHVDTALDDDEAQLPYLRAMRAFEMQREFHNPHVLQPIEIFSHDEFGLIAVEQYVPGTSLKTMFESVELRDRSLSEAHAVSIGIQLAEVLVEASAHDIVHRDIKPDNVMVQVQDDGNVFVHLVDFGLARVKRTTSDVGGPHGATSEHHGEDMQARLSLKVRGQPSYSDDKVHDLTASLTAKRGPLGTPRYMAPEMVLGGIADHRSDQYSLAATLYHLVTRRPPFTGNTPEAIMRNVLTQDLEPPVLVAQSNGFMISEAFSNVLMRALCRDPDDRYQTPLDFLHALHSVQKQSGTTARAVPAANADVPFEVRGVAAHPAVAQSLVNRTVPLLLLLAVLICLVVGAFLVLVPLVR